MDRNIKMDNSDQELSSMDGGVRVYKYRWIVLIIFCLFTVINFMQFLQFNTIANVVKEYYHVENIAVDSTGLVFFIVYIVLFLPVTYLLERYSLKVTAVVSTGLTLIGNLVKVLCAHPDRFYVILIGQTFCAVGQVYMLSIPSKFASTWFGPEEVSTACAIAVLGTQLGAAVGSFIPHLMIRKDDPNLEASILHMMLYNAIATGVIFIIVVVFFRGRPRLPPSQSQQQLLDENIEPPPFLQNFKLLLKNKDFLLILVSFGLTTGIWNSFGILINNIYIHYFPDGDDDVGVITSISVISGGCIGSLVFGVILDKTHQFKKTAIGVMFMTAVTYVFVIYSLIAQSRIATYITIPAFGFFIASGLVISFEYSLEVTYPVPESVSCSVLNAAIFIFSIVGSLAIEGMLTGVGFHIYSFVPPLVVFLLCMGLLFLVSSNLRRRNANIASQNSVRDSHADEESNR